MIRRFAVLLLLATPLFADDNPVVSMETNFGTLKIELYIKDAPNTVVSFLQLCDKKFYDGLKFHRIIKKFMAQGGDPQGTGGGGPGYNIPAEINAHKHVKGTLSMARTFEPNSAGSQFFLCFTDTPFLDNQYTVFGQVTDGMDVLTKIEEEAGVERDGNPPLKEVKIVTAKVVSKPEKLPDLISLKPEEIPFFGVIPNIKESKDGLMIGQLHPKGGGKASGLEVGDLIKKIGDVDVKSLADYAKAVLPSRPGKAVTFTVMRKGEETKVEVTPGKMER
ncbi:MAG: peptidylprolyl isomerase [Planctomycetes bacterium]|nr:peptidylprolyl isomerase [Planctomycetota bacterium]